MEKIIVVDIEATCWDTSPPIGEENEIIEIGICVLDTSTGDIDKNEGILIKPQRSKVSPFCTQLTTLTQEMVSTGILFKNACLMLQTEYDTKNYTWASYGDYDLNMFRKQCESFSVEYPFGKEHINVKNLFAQKHHLTYKGVGMAAALKRLNIPLEGTHHRGVDDAKNIAKILFTLVSGKK